MTCQIMETPKQKVALGSCRKVRPWLALALVAILLPFFWHNSAQAQNRPLKVQLVQNLEFGNIGATNITGTVTIGSDGSKTLSAGLLDLGGLSAPAIFTVQGVKNAAFTITLPASATISGPGASANLSDFQSTPSISGVLDNRGQATISVGATMNITPALWEGAYTGPFDIIVTYQ